MNRKLFGFLVLFLGGMILFAGGGQQSTPSGSVSSSVYSSVVTAPGEFPIVKSSYTMKIFAIQPATIENFVTNELTLAYEKRTGVKIEWEVAPGNAGAERRNLSLVSGDYPDIYLGSSITKEDEIIYGSQGVFLPLNRLIEMYSPNVIESFEEIPYTKSLITAPDGNIYSLPMMSTAIHTQYPNKLWMNSTWLKNLNLKEPATTEEFYQVLRAFKDRDPNGNGSGRNIIPFFCTDNKGSHFVTFFMNSFIQCDQDLRYVTDDEKIQFAFDKPLFREGLRYIRRLVSEGLIDETSFSAAGEQLRRIADNPGDMILGSTVQLSPSGFMDQNGEKQRHYNSVAPLAGPNGVRSAIYNPSAFITTGAFVITKNMKNPEVACRWIDYFYTWEGALEARIGRENHEWYRAGPNELSYSGLPARWGKLTAISSVQNVCWSQWGMGQFNRHDRQTASNDIYIPEGLEKRLFDATSINYMPYMPKKSIPPLYISSDVVRRINQPLNDVRNYVQESIVRFATGDLNLDRDWDSYVANYQRMGVNDILTAYQGAYDSFLKNR